MMDREPGSDLPLPVQFRFDAGSVALNLLTTRGFRGRPDPVERMFSPERLRRWLSANELPEVAVDEAGVLRTQELREAAYAVLARRARSAEVDLLGRWSARPLPGRGLRLSQGTLAWDDPPAELDDVLAGLARGLAGYAVDRPPNLRMCEADTCGMLYLDTSRGHRRRWCSMARCGNAAKAAAHRARTRP